MRILGVEQEAWSEMYLDILNLEIQVAIHILQLQTDYIDTSSQPIDHNTGLTEHNINTTYNL
mgnify:FL=1